MRDWSTPKQEECLRGTYFQIQSQLKCLKKGHTIQHSRTNFFSLNNTTDVLKTAGITTSQSDGDRYAKQQ